MKECFSVDDDDRSCPGSLYVGNHVIGICSQDHKDEDRQESVGRGIVGSGHMSYQPWRIALFSLHYFVWPEACIVD